MVANGSKTGTRAAATDPLVVRDGAVACPSETSLDCSIRFAINSLGRVVGVSKARGTGRRKDDSEFEYEFETFKGIAARLLPTGVSIEGRKP